MASGNAEMVVGGAVRVLAACANDMCIHACRRKRCVRRENTCKETDRARKVCYTG